MRSDHPGQQGAVLRNKRKNRGKHAIAKVNF